MIRDSLSMVCRREEIREDGHRFYCVADASFFGFRGHFDGQPILPGVCQIRFAVEAVVRLTGSVRIQRLEKVKFHNLIVPETEFVIDIGLRGGAALYRMYNDDAEFSSGKIVLK